MNIKNSRSMVVCLGLIAAWIAITDASVATAQNRLIPFQARLTDGAGAAVADNVYPITFSIYDAATGGTAIWSEPHPSASVVAGQVNVILGSIILLDDPNSDGDPADRVEFSTDKFLGITVASGNEMVPRHRVIPSFHARIADTVADGAIDSTKILDGSIFSADIADASITSSKLTADVISSAAILDGAVTSTKIASDAVSTGQLVDGTVQVADLDTTLQNAIIEVGQLRSDLNDLIADLQLSSTVGTLEYPDQPLCNWSAGQASFINIPPNSNCSVRIATGSASPPAALIPGVRFSTLRAGSYRIRATGTVGTSVNSNDHCVWRLSDGTNHGQIYERYDGSTGDGDQTVNLFMEVSYTTDQSDLTFQVQSKRVSSSTLDNCYIFVSQLDRSVRFVVERLSAIE